MAAEKEKNTVLYVNNFKMQQLHQRIFRKRRLRNFFPQAVYLISAHAEYA